jgi:hypothetical protein
MRNGNKIRGLTVNAIGIIVFFLLSFIGRIFAVVDLAVSYRNPFFQGEGRSNPLDWTSKLMVHYGKGHAFDSLDDQGKKCALLSGVGQLDIARLGLGSQIDAAKMPVSNSYWNTPKTKFSSTFQPSGNDGKIDLGGRCEAQDLGFELTQFITYGFFASVYVPFRQVTIDHINYKNKGPADVNTVNIANFFTNDFDKILKEYGMQPLATPYKKSGMSDATVSVGWHGYGKIGAEWLMDVSGDLQVGALLPIAGKVDDQYVAAVPLGYNKNYGVLARGSGEVGLFDWVSVGAYVDATLFFSQKQTTRMRTHESQSGWLRLGRGFAKIDPGTIWDCGCYLRFGALVQGLSIFGGYSFTRQESTRLTVRDEKVKVMLTTLSDDATKLELRESTSQGNKDSVVNADPYFSAWENQALHLGAMLELGGKRSIFSPKAQVEYSYPFDGKRIFKMPMLVGTFGLRVCFDF